MRGGSLLLGIVCLLATASTVAGTLYRCDIPDGSRSYVSKRVPGARLHGDQPFGRRSARAGARRRGDGQRHPDRPRCRLSRRGPRSADRRNRHFGADRHDDDPGSGPARPATPGSRAWCKGQVYSYIKDGVRHYTSKRAAGRGQRQCHAHDPVQLHRDLLRLRRAAGRQLRHDAPQYRRLPQRDRRGGAPARRRRGDRAGHHPCRVGLQPQRALARRARRA